MKPNTSDLPFSPPQPYILSALVTRLARFPPRQITSPGTVDAAATTPVGEAPREGKLSPLPSTDERHVSFEEDGGVPGEEGPPKKKMTARERWYWAFDKIVAKLNVSTCCCAFRFSLVSGSASRTGFAHFPVRSFIHPEISLCIFFLSFIIQFSAMLLSLRRLVKFAEREISRHPFIIIFFIFIVRHSVAV